MSLPNGLAAKNAAFVVLQKKTMLQQPMVFSEAVGDSHHEDTKSTISQATVGTALRRPLSGHLRVDGIKPSLPRGSK